MGKEVRMKLSPPWCTHLSMLKAIFDEDKDITIKYDNEFYNNIKIYVNNVDKAFALDKIISAWKEYGNVNLRIMVIPPNGETIKNENNLYDTQQLYEIAFKGNPVFSFAKTFQGLFNNKIIYVVFKNKVVQFFNDDLNDIYGNMTTLYENIAREIFNSESNVNRGVTYCTDLPEGLKKPLGEWP